MTGSGFAQALVFGFLSNPASTRAELNQAAATAGMDMSTQGFDQRFNAKAVVFLDTLLQAVLEQVVTGITGTASLLSRFSGVYVMDSSMVNLPPALAAVWQGNNSVDDAAVKVAVQWDVQAGSLGLWLSGGRVHDQRTGVGATILPPGSLRLADLGFFNLERFQDDLSRQVDFFSRYKLGTSLFTRAGQALDLAALLRRQGTRPLDLPILLGAHRLTCRLMALPVSAEVKGKRRARLRQTARRKQQPVSAAALALAGWTLYVTSLPAERLALSEAPILGMTRWQIERLFKLWKSSGLLDEWRSHDPWRVWSEFYGKLLALLVQHWLLLVSAWQRLDRSLHRAVQVIRKHAFHLAATFHTLNAFTLALTVVARVVLQTCGMSKRAAHPLTFQYWLKSDFA
ncbi:MAG: IS4 family transposase [Chloroflexi bacterium]|nr:IS4 family transposase [Chloroflexota bacterium]